MPRAIARPGRVVTPPGRPGTPGGARVQGARQRRPEHEIAFGGSPSARSMTSATTAAPLPSRRICPFVDRRMASPTIKVGSPIDSRSAVASEASCDASRIGPDTRDPSPARPWRWPATTCPQPPCTTPVIPRIERRQRAMDSVAGRAQQRAGGNPHRHTVRFVVGHCIGDLGAHAPNSSAPRRCHGWSTSSSAHVPAVGGVEIAPGLQMLGDQRRVLVG